MSSSKSEGRDPDKVRVLVVDDDQLLLETMRAVLSTEFDVETCISAEHALTMLGRQPFDVLIADHGLPTMNGDQLIQAVARSHPEISALLLTGSQDAYAIGKARGYSVSLKPVGLDRLFAVVTQLAQLARMKSKVASARQRLKR